MSTSSLLTFSLALFFGNSITAAPITWNPAVDVTTTPGNSTDVFTTGTLVEAFNAQADDATLTDLTINGVTFVGTKDLILDDTTRNGGSNDFSNNTDGGDTDYDTLLSSLDFGGNGSDTTMSVGNGTLSTGAVYQIQVWFVDDRSSQDGRVMRFGDDLGNTIDLNDQFSIGTFTADASAQTISLAAQGFGRAHVTAYQLRALPTGPPPSPNTPSNLIATAGDTTVTLDWDDNNQFGFANFIVRRAETPGGPYADVSGATPSESTYLDTGLTNGTTYYYVVAAENTEPETSSHSNEASATPEIFVPDAPLVPSNLTITNGNNRTTLNWDDNEQEGFFEFRIKRATVASGPYTFIGSTTNSIYTDTTALNDITYYYVVTAVNSDLVESVNSSEAEGNPSVSATPPNFVFIITDDQDTYSIGAYRNSEPVEPSANGQPYTVDTPHIDRLAAEGMLFHQARIMGSDVGAVCTGSRTCIMSGKNTWQRTEGVSAPVTFPGIFNRGVRTGINDLPYATYRTCKNGNSYATANGEFTIVNDATRRGNTDESGSEWHGDRALEHIEHWRTNHEPNSRPFLMYLGFSHPHDTRNARTNPDLTGRYGCVNTTNPAAITLNPLSPPLPFNHLSATPATYPAHPFDNGHLNVRDENTAVGIGQYRTEPVVRNEIGRNFACVDWIDQQVGEVLARLEDPNDDGDTSDSVLDNTYIVFTSDHGIAIGRHGLQGKQNLYEHTWKVPYIVRGPGIAAGSETDALVYLHDTFPTFCDIAGIDIPATIDDNDGQSFRQVLQGNSDSHRAHLYGLYAGGSKPGMRSVTNGRFKLIKYDVDNNNTQVTQMFDLESNPFELLPEHGHPNIADLPAYASLRQQLEEELMAQRIENADPFDFLGDRTLLRFEDGVAGQPANNLLDRLPFANDGTPMSGNGSTLPSHSSDVPAAKDFIIGEPNTLSLDLEGSLQQYVQVNDNSSLDFGNAPFTIEAWVKFESLPTGDNLASTRPVVMKKVIGSNDSALDYMLLAAAGNYGSATTFNRLAVHLGGSAIISTLSIPDTNWHYISVALDPVSNTLRFTMDEEVDIQTTTETGTANSGPLIIGAHFNNSSVIDSAFDGLIDEVSITNGFLSLSELQPLAAVATVEDFQICSFQLNENDSSVSITFESDETRLYSIQHSSSLESADWTDVELLVPGEPGVTETTITDLPLPNSADTTRNFYRVVLSN